MFLNVLGKVPDTITAGHPTITIRILSRPVARVFVAVADAPLTAPVANLSGGPNPTKAEHVYDNLNGKAGPIRDGGPRACSVGLEITAADGLHDDDNLWMLRPGDIALDDIEKALAEDLDKSDVPVQQDLTYRRDYKGGGMNKHQPLLGSNLILANRPSSSVHTRYPHLIPLSPPTATMHDVPGVKSCNLVLYLIYPQPHDGRFRASLHLISWGWT